MSSLPDQTGRTHLITGATSGLGRAAALALLRAGAEVWVVGRSPQKLEALAQEAEAGPRLRTLRCDLQEMAQVKALVEEVRARVPRLDVLINNAGAIFKERGLTSEGLERTFAVDHMAYFALTLGLLPLLEASAPARVVSTASDAYRAGRLDFEDLQLERGYGRLGFTAYSNVKLMNLLFTRELARRTADRGIAATCHHPGFVGSNMGLNNGWAAKWVMALTRPLQVTPLQGADTLLWLATAPEAEWESGGYYAKRRLVQPAAVGRDAEAARRLWETSERILASI